jgi:formylmethanofuran dehydrogenase subunit C
VSPAPPRRRVRESGFGIVMVLGLGVLVLGMGALAHFLFNSAINTSDRHVTYEQALHLAEQGIDQTMARLAENPGYDTDATFGPAPPTVVTAADERAWVEQQAAAAPASSVQSSPGGEVVAIKPSNRTTIYAVSWVPSRSAAERTRVLKQEYEAGAGTFVEAAIMSEGTLTVPGNPEVSGSAGSVHANGNISISGSPDISGNLSTAGSLYGSGNVGGTTTAGAPRRTVPTVDPRVVWQLHARSATYSGSWYDLCPDGTVRLPTGTSPCAGTVVADASSDEFRGFKLSGDNWDVSGSSGVYHGVYYAYRKNIKVSGNPGTSSNPWQATLIAEGEVTSTSGSCAQRSRGDIEISGNTSLTSFLGDLALIAGRDIKVSGNPNQTYAGLFTALEQVDVSGNPQLIGAIISSTTCDSAGSPVSQNSISGNMKLSFDGSLEIPLDGGLRVTLWQEL